MSKIVYSFGKCKFCGLDKVLKDNVCVNCRFRKNSDTSDFMGWFKDIINKEGK